MRPAEGVFARSFDDELLIVDLAHGEYFALDGVGSMLWQGLDAGRTVEEIAYEVVEVYDVTYEQSLRDLSQLLADIVERGLLVIASARSVYGR
jgi:hypothetical protein